MRLENGERNKSRKSLLLPTVDGEGAFRYSVRCSRKYVFYFNLSIQVVIITDVAMPCIVVHVQASCMICLKNKVALGAIL